MPTCCRGTGSCKHNWLYQCQLTAGVCTTKTGCLSGHSLLGFLQPQPMVPAPSHCRGSYSHNRLYQRHSLPGSYIHNLWYQFTVRHFLAAGRMITASLFIGLVNPFPALVQSPSWYRKSMSSRTLGSAGIRHLFQSICRVFGRTFYSLVREGLQSDSHHVGRPSQACWLPTYCYSHRQILALQSSGHRISGRTLDNIALCGLLHYRGVRAGQRVREHFQVGEVLDRPVTTIVGDVRTTSSLVAVTDTCPCLPTM